MIFGKTGALFSAGCAVLILASELLAGEPAIVNGPGASVTVTNIAMGSTWKYLDDGSDQGTNWREISFNDSGWSSGPAELGYGDGDEATVVSYGPDKNNKYITTYFRCSFIDDGSVVCTNARIRILRDDGSVSYLNGTEINRANMPSGEIGYQTLASSAIEETENTSYTTNWPVKGTNFLAVEIHQADLKSSDISFDFEFISYGVGGSDGASNITASAATLYGNLMNTGSVPTTVHLYWGDNDGTNNKAAWDHWTNFGVQAEGLLTTNITGLTPDTTYYFRFYATNSYGDDWAIPSESFQSGSGDPVIINNAASNLTVNSANLNGYLTSTGLATTTVHLYWGDNDGTNNKAAWDHWTNFGVQAE
ncbi:MAG: fibronectin type III domain-containing protein, partial [Lentisphaerae bacterium]|nr:fibronectin type III domain-containing protein [Lentisphaerota bacterium]